jgi:myo-inositol-1(or 4)-monophosphatase
LNLKPWDVAAGALLVLEAGGTVTDFGGGFDWLHGRQIIASNEKMHPWLHNSIRESGL